MFAPYVDKQVRALAAYIPARGTLLDFGCGDLSLAAAIHALQPKLAVTGVDVVDSGVRIAGVDFRLYGGKRLPFTSGAFDTTIAYHVFHHTTDPHRMLVEAMRVTKRQLLIIEPVWRSPLDLFFMKMLDRINNGWRSVNIAMPFTFQKESTWITWAKEHGWNVKKVSSAGVLPEWLPIGVTKLFVLVPR